MYLNIYVGVMLNCKKKKHRALKQDHKFVSTIVSLFRNDFSVR